MKKFQKTFLLVFAFVAITASVFTSCKDDETSIDVKEVIMDKQWKLTSVETEKVDADFSAGVTMLLQLTEMVIDFNADGVMLTTYNTLGLPGEPETGTWSISSDNKTLTIDGTPATIESCTETTLKISSTDPGALDFGDGDTTYDTGKLTFVYTAVK